MNIPYDLITKLTKSKGDIVEELDMYVSTDVGRWIAELEGKRVPKYTPSPICYGRQSWQYTSLRSLVTGRYNMWALVDKEWTSQLQFRRGERVLEVMAGAGWLQKAIKATHNVKYTAIDNRSSHSWGKQIKTVSRVLRKDAVEYVRTNGSNFDTLICSWPNYASPIFTNICTEWHNTGKDRKIIYIGEGNGGCTADDSFFAGFTADKYHSIPNWDGLHDEGMIGTFTPAQRN